MLIEPNPNSEKIENKRAKLKNKTEIQHRIRWQLEQETESKCKKDYTELKNSVYATKLKAWKTIRTIKRWRTRQFDLADIEK